MQFPSRRARIALLAGIATLGIAGTASASTADYSTGNDTLTITVSGADTDEQLDCVGGFVKFGAPGAEIDPTRDGLNAGTTGCGASVALVVVENDADQREQPARPARRQARRVDRSSRRARSRWAAATTPSTAPSSARRSRSAPVMTRSSPMTAPTR